MYAQLNKQERLFYSIWLRLDPRIIRRARTQRESNEAHLIQCLVAESHHTWLRLASSAKRFSHQGIIQCIL